MPIRGLTDRTRLPRLAKIRLGEKRQGNGGKEYPSALDHFNFRDCPELEKIFGNDCREIYPIIIPAEEEQAWFHTSLSAYSKSGLFCRSEDGTTATRVNKGLDEHKKPLDPQGWAFLEEQRKRTGESVDVGDMFDMPCPGEECPYYERKMCKKLGRLFIVVVDSPRFGVYEISTTSVNSILNILSKARAIAQPSMAGRISGIPLALKLLPLQVQPEGKAKTVYVLDLEFKDGGIKRLMQASRMSTTQLLGLPEHVDDTPDDLMPEGGAQLGRALGETKATAPPKKTAPARAQQQTAGPVVDLPKSAPAPAVVDHLEPLEPMSILQDPPDDVDFMNDPDTLFPLDSDDASATAQGHRDSTRKAAISGQQKAEQRAARAPARPAAAPAAQAPRQQTPAAGQVDFTDF